MAATMPGMLRDSRRTLMQSAARGAALIGAMVLVGVILLQVVDDGGGGGGGGNGGNGVVDTTDDTTPDDTTPTGDTRPPAEVRTLVLNAGGAAGAAGELTTVLIAQGYTTLPAADDPIAKANTQVTCKAGFEADDDPLLFIVAGNGYPNAEIVEPFPSDPVPPGSEEADCVVFIGQA